LSSNLSVGGDTTLATTVVGDTLSVAGVVTLGADVTGVLSHMTLSSAQLSDTLSVGGQSNLAGAVLSGVLSVGSDIVVGGTGVLYGPSSFTIDPATHGDDTGTVVIAGNLQVDGTTVTVNSTNLDVTDLNITVAKDAINAAAANGAGLTVAGASATLLYESSGDNFVVNKQLRHSSDPVNDDDLSRKSYVDAQVAAAGANVDDNSLGFDKLEGIKVKVVTAASQFTDLNDDGSSNVLLYVLNNGVSSAAITTTAGASVGTAYVGLNLFVFDGSAWSTNV